MRLSEGLASLVAEQLRPQFVADASTHPRFKYFSEAGEDPYRGTFRSYVLSIRMLPAGVTIKNELRVRVQT